MSGNLPPLHKFPPFWPISYPSPRIGGQLPISGEEPPSESPLNEALSRLSQAASATETLVHELEGRLKAVCVAMDDKPGESAPTVSGYGPLVDGLHARVAEASALNARLYSLVKRLTI